MNQSPACETSKLQNQHWNRNDTVDERKREKSALNENIEFHGEFFFSHEIKF